MQAELLRIEEESRVADEKRQKEAEKTHAEVFESVEPERKRLYVFRCSCCQQVFLLGKPFRACLVLASLYLIVLHS